MTEASIAAEQAFKKRPHRTLITLSIPVLLSLIAEPITGLVDTAFVARQGNIAGAALGAGTVALSSVFWIFNFLSVGTQTEVARSLGKGKQSEAAATTTLALLIALAIGISVSVVWPFADELASLLGANGEIRNAAADYIRYRLLGAPAVLGVLVIFGALRGLQDMRTPLYIALIINVTNIVLDILLIGGFGPIPAYGVIGAASASTISQWVGIIYGLWVIRKRLGFARSVRWHDAGNFIQVGSDLFFRTGLVTVYLSIATRVATQIGADAGSAHQAIRQIWILSALVMEAFAVTAQSLIAYFMGSEEYDVAKRVAGYCIGWGVATGVALMIALILAENRLAAVLVPATAIPAFSSAWLVASLSQPLNAVAFITDGIHWGTGDYRYLRNAMFLATLAGGFFLFLIDPTSADALRAVWITTILWIVVRSIAGVIRVWPGIGNSPFTLQSGHKTADLMTSVTKD